MKPVFTVIPAVDLRGGRCVRLRQGQASEVTVYSDAPEDMARHWAAQGAAALHIVDLDGAFAGRPEHTAVIRAMIAAVQHIPVQVGGGLRTDADIQAVLDAGAARAIIGTRALGSAEELRRLAEKFGANLAVGIDARNGMVQIKGWTETTATTAAELAQSVAAAGIQTIIYTDTATDGMLQGPNYAALERLCRAVACRVIASGGVAEAEHVRRLAQLQLPNLDGVIVGKALYEQTVTLPELLEAAQTSPPPDVADRGCS